MREQWEVQILIIRKQGETKGYLLANKEGRYTHYQPTIPFEQYQKKKLEETCKMLFDGDAELFRKMAQPI